MPDLLFMLRHSMCIYKSKCSKMSCGLKYLYYLVQYFLNLFSTKKSFISCGLFIFSFRHHSVEDLMSHFVKISKSGVCRGQRALVPRVLVLKTVVSCLVDVWTWIQSSSRTIRTLNCWVNLSAPHVQVKSKVSWNLGLAGDSTGEVSH